MNANKRFDGKTDVEENVIVVVKGAAGTGVFDLHATRVEFVYKLVERAASNGKAFGKFVWGTCVLLTDQLIHHVHFLRKIKRFHGVIINV